MRGIMRTACAAAVAALVAFVPSAQAADSVVRHDAETGFTFSEFRAQYALGDYITYRVAIPADVAAGAPYDAVLQVVAPVAVGWAGLAWGGSMTANPLAVSWQNGDSAVVSSRFATSHSTPAPYAAAAYTPLRTGTRANATHWQLTARCAGCTAWAGGAGGRNVSLAPAGAHRLAFAASTRPPLDGRPADPAAPIPVHGVTGYWSHDFAAAANADFAALVRRNL